ncbi:VTT domain-containing protein [Salipaludibacillus sp. CUR1]|uniref:DedA family protein n=1 Tax=Salipaludibacillus sp. CUR1 TaxID=2820003 RepID=UPI001E3C9B70|nr:VTT domain-containing protein [Salipaludibacillus sp. CUR1]MCE7791496.1 VTT domain-containing protein [Salipaludibacillus sp. CUR1]
MVEFIFNILKELGWIGLAIGVAVEALSIPFPAAVFVLAYGYILNPSWTQIFLFSIITSLIYVVVSFVPYYVSIRYESVVRKKLPKHKVRFAQKWIDRYGEWMIAVGRFIGMGYITYIAGLSRMNIWKFAGLTFAGFYPLSVIMFYLGNLGNLEVMVDRLQQVQWAIYTVLGIGLAAYISFRFYRRKKYKNGKQKDNSSWQASAD